jgi:ferric-dicitrate binding protein FerR (iron transport regulator)
MYSRKKIDKLLSDEDFQDDILNVENSMEDGTKYICDKYSITEKEFAYAVKFFSSISLKKEKLNQEEITYALLRLRNRIANTTASSTAEKQKKVDLITWISRIAAILSMPLLLTTFYFYQEYSILQRNSITSYPQKTVYNTFHASLGAKTQVALPDGSLVWLNSGSTLTCPTVFDSESRNVELKGEAFFEVVKNEKVPMIVTAGNLNVKVYGTKFNLNAFPEDGIFKTTLVEGKVSIIAGDKKEEHLLNPGYTASYAIDNQKLEINKVSEMDAFTGWKEGKLLFHDERFAEIIKRLERWYNVDIQLSDESLGRYTLYATFFDENIEQVLDIFSGSIPILIEYPKRVKNMDGIYSKRQIIIKRDTTKKI